MWILNKTKLIIQSFKPPVILFYDFKASSSQILFQDLYCLSSPHGKASTNMSDWSGGFRMSVWPARHSLHASLSVVFESVRCEPSENPNWSQMIEMSESGLYVALHWKEQAPPIAPDHVVPVAPVAVILNKREHNSVPATSGGFFLHLLSDWDFSCMGTSAAFSQSFK